MAKSIQSDSFIPINNIIRTIMRCVQTLPALWVIACAARLIGRSNAAAAATTPSATFSSPSITDDISARHQKAIRSLMAGGGANPHLITSPGDMNFRKTEQTDTKICELMQGTYTAEHGCKICPIESADRECCVYNLEDFSFVCEKCLVVDGQEVCGKVNCINDGGSQTISCNGCTGGDDVYAASSRVAESVLSAGEVCVDFTCPSQGRCTCNAATLGGKDCHTCDIDGGNMPTMNCATTSAAVGQRSLHGMVAATAMLSVLAGVSLAVLA